MSEYFSDRVIAAIDAGGPTATQDHAIAIVFTVARLHASLMYHGGTLRDMAVAESAVRMTMAVDYGCPNGAVRMEKARYALLEFWLNEFEKRSGGRGGLGRVYVQLLPDAG